MNLNDIMQQAQKLQGDLQQAQANLTKLEIDGEAGAGLVKVTMTGKYDVKKITIDPSLLEEDVEMLEDVLAAAMNDCVRKVETAVKENMGNLPNMPTMPAGFKMPF